MSAPQKNKAQKRTRKCQGQGRFAVLNQVAKVVIGQKVEFEQNARLHKKTSIHMCMWWENIPDGGKRNYKGTQ